jgi:hypothetical protein
MPHYTIMDQHTEKHPLNAQQLLIALSERAATDHNVEGGRARALQETLEELAAATPTGLGGWAVITYLRLAVSAPPTSGSIGSYAGRVATLADLHGYALDLTIELKSGMLREVPLDLPGALALSDAWIEHVTPGPGCAGEPRHLAMLETFRRERRALVSLQGTSATTRRRSSWVEYDHGQFDTTAAAEEHLCGRPIAIVRDPRKGEETGGQWTVYYWAICDSDGRRIGSAWYDTETRHLLTDCDLPPRPRDRRPSARVDAQRVLDAWACAAGACTTTLPCAHLGDAPAKLRRVGVPAKIRGASVYRILDAYGAEIGAARHEDGRLTIHGPAWPGRRRRRNGAPSKRHTVTRDLAVWRRLLELLGAPLRRGETPGDALARLEKTERFQRLVK